MKSIVVLLLILAVPASSQWLLDGDLDDWGDEGLFVADPTGDPRKAVTAMNNDGRDLTALHAALVDDALRVGIGFSFEERGDDEAGLLLLVDADRDPSTGKSRGGLGCELIWDVGVREGEVFLPDFSGPIRGAKELREFLGVLVAPTVTGPAVEVMIPRGDHELFGDRGIHLVVLDERSDDRVPDDGSLTLLWPTDASPPASLPTDRHAATQVRLASYNVEHDGLFELDDVERQAALKRLLTTIDADVWIFCEVWDHDGEQTRARVGELLARDLSAWSAVRHDGGNVLLSRFPVKESWAVIDDVRGDDGAASHRLTAALLETPGRDALVVANHWRCCDADAARRFEAERMADFLRDARTPGGRLDLAAGTPVILAGDFNLVGDRAQVTTLLDAGLTAVDLRHVDRPVMHTWHVTDSSFGPGRLDWVFVNAHARTPRHFVIDSPDARRASDHFPLVVDLAWE